MGRRWAVVMAAAVALTWVPADAGLPDRLERFRELAASRLGMLELTGLEPGADAMAELYALVDEEIVDSLRSGGPFASAAFIQERLDGFNSAWGGTAFRVRRLGRPGGPTITVGTFTLSSVGQANSIRLYGGSKDHAHLLQVVSREGIPAVHEWPWTRDGLAQFVASWLGPASGRGIRPLRLELWRQRHPDGVALTWSTASRFPDGLWVSDFSVRPGEIVFRYGLRYPGWKPGCEGQTEQEDIYRYVASTDTVELARRRVFNEWHRELQRTVARFFALLRSGDGRALAELVPDPSLRARLPAALVGEPACEQVDPEAQRTVIVAATEERGTTRTPWSLWWRRQPAGWRLADAAPVLE